MALGFVSPMMYWPFGVRISRLRNFVVGAVRVVGGRGAGVEGGGAS